MSRLKQQPRWPLSNVGVLYNPFWHFHVIRTLHDTNPTDNLFWDCSKIINWKNISGDPCWAQQRLKQKLATDQGSKIFNVNFGWLYQYEFCQAANHNNTAAIECALICYLQRFGFIEYKFELIFIVFHLLIQIHVTKETIRFPNFPVLCIVALNLEELGECLLEATYDIIWEIDETQALFNDKTEIYTKLKELWKYSAIFLSLNSMNPNYNPFQDYVHAATILRDSSLAPKWFEVCPVDYSNSVNSIIFLNHVTNDTSKHKSYKDYLQTIISKKNNQFNERKDDCDKYDYWPGEDCKTTATNSSFLKRNIVNNHLAIKFLQSTQFWKLLEKNIQSKIIKVISATTMSQLAFVIDFYVPEWFTKIKYINCLSVVGFDVLFKSYLEEMQCLLYGLLIAASCNKMVIPPDLSLVYIIAGISAKNLTILSPVFYSSGFVMHNHWVAAHSLFRQILITMAMDKSNKPIAFNFSPIILPLFRNWRQFCHSPLQSLVFAFYYLLAYLHSSDGPYNSLMNDWSATVLGQFHQSSKKIKTHL